MTYPDHRTLCAELSFIWDRSTNPDDLFINILPLVDRARAAPPQPVEEPQFTAEEIELHQAPWSYLEPPQPVEGPGVSTAGASADSDVIRALVMAEAALADIGDADREPGDDLAWCERRAAEALPFVRDVLAFSSYGTTARSVPVAVSDRLPGPGDCDAEGRCWWFSPPACGLPLHKTLPCWTLDSEVMEGDTHWLPANALPLPREGE